jgi:hypothetical protein
METYIRCALNKNEFLRDNDYEEPFDWNSVSRIRRMAIFDSQACDSYAPGQHLTVSPDGNLSGYDHNGTHDDEQLLAIAKHRGYGKEHVEEYWKAGRER